jgi:hypothetical protein
MGEWQDFVRQFQAQVSEMRFDRIREQVRETMAAGVEGAKAQGMEEDEAVMFVLDLMLQPFDEKGKQRQVYPRLYEMWIADLYPDVFSIYLDDEEDDDAS